MRRALLLVGLVLVAGCLGEPAGPTRISGEERVAGQTIFVEKHALVVERGATYEVNGGALRLSDDPEIVVDGRIEVRGTLIVRDAEISGVHVLIAYPGSRLVLENVTLKQPHLWPSISLATNDFRIAGSALDVHKILVTGSGELAGNTIRSSTELPAIELRKVRASVTGNTIDAFAFGVVLRSGEGEISGNTVTVRATRAAASPIIIEGVPAVIGIAAEKSTVTIADNVVHGGTIGIGAIESQVEARGNTVRNASYAGIGMQACSGATLVSENVVEGAGRAGIGMLQCGSTTRIEGNEVFGVTTSATSYNDSGIGIGLEASSPRISGNDLHDNDIGVGVRGGTPVINGNSFVNNRAYAVARGDLTGFQDVQATPIDATDNFWGLPSGPVVAAEEEEGPLAPPAGAQRVTPGVRYAPWRATAG